MDITGCRCSDSSQFDKTDFDNLPKEGSKQLTWNSWWVKNKHWPWMYSVVFLTQFWPPCGMVHFTSESLISSWYTYEIKIRIRYLLPQVWNKIITYLPTYQSKKSRTLSPNRVHVNYQEPEKTTHLRFGTFSIRIKSKGKLFIAKSITID